MNKPAPDTFDARLDELRALLHGDDPIEPTDLVDEWTGWAASFDHEHRQTVERHVPTDEIVGTAPQNTDRLNEGRLVRIVNKMARGEWDPSGRHRSLPHLERHPNGDYYVGSDGNHRVLAYKFLGLETIRAEVDEYEYKS